MGKVETSSPLGSGLGDGAKNGLDSSDNNVNMSDFRLPEGWNLETVVEAIKTGQGWFHFKDVFSEKDIAMARERVYYHNKADIALKSLTLTPSHQLHSNYQGLVWGCINKGQVFEKMAQHPIILAISDVMLGESCQISSIAANTVIPGADGQLPHLDYPYYKSFFPSSSPNVMDSAPPISLQFMTLLTDFTKDNGGTAIRPNSHKNPSYPEDKEDFFRNAIQIEGQAGDMFVFTGTLQHCAMPNTSDKLRSCVIQQMVPIYVRPFEDMAKSISQETRMRSSKVLKKLLALDHPYPILKV